MIKTTYYKDGVINSECIEFPSLNRALIYTKNYDDSTECNKKLYNFETF